MKPLTDQASHERRLAHQQGRRTGRRAAGEVGHRPAPPGGAAALPGRAWADPQAVAGIATGNEFLISNAEGSTRGAAAIAYNDDLEEYLVVWSDGRENAAYWDIYGQIIANNGQPSFFTSARVVSKVPIDAIGIDSVDLNAERRRVVSAG